ncbi:hypothetical protein DL768_001789 [Monosporascus sp. mg162]|nr:hypothetical protein DL768_001789 [Monosporascus sp. mg162]
MRFSLAAAVLGLPLLAAAEVPEYQAQFQSFLGPYYDKIKSYVPNPNKHDPVGAAEAKAGSLNMDILTVDNWNSTLYGPVTPETTTPVEWWLLITGNRTCFGHCTRVEEAFNQTAAKFALEPNAPHIAMLNCDNQPVLCNAWSAPAGALWIFEILPAPAPVNIWTKRINMTTATSDDFMKVHKEGHREVAKIHDGFFHPYTGPLAQYGLSIPIGYVLWLLNAVPSWAFMVGVSMLSRRMMTNRVQNQMAGGPRPPAAGQAVPR